MRLYYARQRKAILSCIENSTLNSYCQVIERDSGLHFLLGLHTERSDEELSERFRKEGVYIRPLSDYYQSPRCAHVFILNYSNLQVNQLETALKAIAKCLNSG